MNIQFKTCLTIGLYVTLYLLGNFFVLYIRAQNDKIIKMKVATMLYFYNLTSI